MTIANRNKRVTFQRRGTGQSATGQPNGTFTNVMTIWAAINPISGREYFNASGERAEVTHKIDVRYCSELADLKPKDRALYGSRVFNIRSVINVEERGRKLLLMCTEHVN